MRKFFTLLLTLFTVTGVAVAQPAMINKGYIDSKSTKVDTSSVCNEGGRDILDVEIIASNGETFQHPQHPENGLICPLKPWLTTSQQYSSYLWESDFEMLGGTPDGPAIRYMISEPGFIKVTVWDDDGNSGTDCIQFNIKALRQLEDFLMEIGDDNHPTFSGIVSDQIAIDLYRENFLGGESYGQTFSLTAGLWTYKDQDAYYDEDNLWVYHEYLYDTCRYSQFHALVPGILLNTREESGEWYLDMKTLLQGDNGYYHDMYGVDFVYLIFTVDENGNRHHFIDEYGEPVIIPKDIVSWHIPGQHIDKHYQVGVAQIKEDSYELLSLSNKVENPLLYPTGIEEGAHVFMVYPNPAQGRFTVEGMGQMTVSNMLGQTVMTKEIDGKTTIELPQGLYFVKMGGKTRKIVVE